jgi:malonyl CoA-acyl carrier protein transacylase
VSGKVIDLKQATLNALVERFGQLTEAIVASNVRYIRIQEEVTNGFADMRRLIGDSVGDAETRLTKRINETHSEVLQATNQIITMQDQVWKLLHEREEAPEQGTDGETDT